MSDQEQTRTVLSRRSFLKVLGGAGATAAFMSTVSPMALGTAYAAGNAAPSLVQQENPRYVLASLGKDGLAQMYTRMTSSRKWETKMKDLFVSGKDGLYGAFHTYVGEEAVANGVMGALRDDDFIASTHRGHGHLIAKGGDLDKMSGEIFFRQGGYNKGFGGSMHITDASKGILGMNGILSPQMYLVPGAAYGIKVRGTDQVAVAFIGDGACNGMYFWSGIRESVHRGLPAIFVVENNGYEISAPTITNVINGQVAPYVTGLPMSSVSVDGNDVAAVYAATKDAVDRARAGGGPSLIECMTYRWYDHAGFAGAKEGVDGAFGLPYRPDSEVKMWMERDPIPRFRTFLTEEAFLTEDELNAIDADAQAAVDASVEFARNSPKCTPEDGVLNVYAEGAVAATQFLAG